LNKDVEVPVYSYEVGKFALNKLHWSHDGKRVAVGDVNGKISIFNVDKEVL
jgi:dynein intermediate chain